MLHTPLTSAFMAKESGRDAVGAHSSRLVCAAVSMERSSRKDLPHRSRRESIIGPVA